MDGKRFRKAFSSGFVMRKILRVVSGPTGSGKTSWASRLAEVHGYPLFNTDAFQFYREIPILSNQPADRERWQFMAFRSLSEPLNSGEFGRLSERSLEQDGIWVGTGLYLGAALYGLDEDRKKGVPFQGTPKREYRAVVFDPDRARLYQALDQRVDEMIQCGAIEEGRKISDLVRRGEVPPANPILKAIGLKHLLSHFLDDLSLEISIREWKRDTRRLAKRQWTWLRKFMPASASCLWIDPAGNLDVAERFLMGE
jgi:tRNA A37 N6-isopentenylltransferase MiaA